MFEEDYHFELAFIKCGKCANYTFSLRCQVYPTGIPETILDGAECQKLKETCNDTV